MMAFLTQPVWSPYIAGACIGILCCGVFLLSDRPLGCSTAFVKARGLITRLLDRRKVERMEYYRMVVPQVDWALMVIPGIVIGAFVSSVLSGQFHVFLVPPAWGAAFGDKPVVRVFWALAGGILLGFGARWAGGCTSGHGISGSVQLSLASIVTACCFFIGGIATAMALFRFAGA